MRTSNVATPVPACTEMEARFAPCRALMGGTLAMRRAGRAYLPRFPKEGNARHEARLGASVLYGGGGWRILGGTSDELAPDAVEQVRWALRREAGLGRHNEVGHYLSLRLTQRLPPAARLAVFT